MTINLVAFIICISLGQIAATIVIRKLHDQEVDASVADGFDMLLAFGIVCWVMQQFGVVFA